MNHAVRKSLTATALFAAVLALIADAAVAASAEPTTHAAASGPATVIYDLAELWRLDSEGDKLVFGIIAAAVFDADDRTYLLDTQLARIYVLDAGGEHVATIGRPGEGPGEFQYPSSIAWWDRETLAVAHAMAGRLELIDVRGEPAGSVHFSRDGERRPVPVTRAAPLASGLAVEVSNAFSDGKIVRLSVPVRWHYSIG